MKNYMDAGDNKSMPKEMHTDACHTKLTKKEKCGEKKEEYRTAMIITGLVVAIATFHFVRIFNSRNAAFDVTLSGVPFNDAYRYVDWFLTVATASD